MSLTDANAEVAGNQYIFFSASNNMFALKSFI